MTTTHTPSSSLHWTDLYEGDYAELLDGDIFTGWVILSVPTGYELWEKDFHSRHPSLAHAKRACPLWEKEPALL